MANVSDASRIEYAKNRLGSDIASYAKSDLIGINPCGVSLSSLLVKKSIIDVYECSGFQYLNTEQKDCLLGRLTADLTSNCC